MERLKQEVVRLTQELDQTSSEKIQSAQYGLVLLEEKESLESRCQVNIIMYHQSARHFSLQLIDQVDKKGRNASEVKCNVNLLINLVGLCDIVTYSAILSKTKRLKVVMK